MIFNGAPVLHDYDILSLFLSPFPVLSRFSYSLSLSLSSTLPSFLPLSSSYYECVRCLTPLWSSVPRSSPSGRCLFSSELLIKTPNLASGSLSLSFSFATSFSFSLFPLLFKHTHTQGAKVGISPQLVPPSLAWTLQIFQQRGPITVIRLIKVPRWTTDVIISHHSSAGPFLFSQPWPIWSRASCVWSPKEINHPLQNNGSLEMLVITEPPQTRRI